ncbi:selenocysteine-specific translation elongation factor [Brevibacterium paucivorans]
MSFVVATAGHVDHGKSALVRALTGSDPDRLDEEKRRGLTIDLGFAHCTLPSGTHVSFVDVPGHERFIGNMLAGLGPAPIVCFVVAADEGWSAQSTDHRDALEALGINRGVIVLTKCDSASPAQIAHVSSQARTELSCLTDAPVVTTSAVTGDGLPELLDALDAVTSAAPPPATDGRVRIWVDRAFSITGAGTIVTGTLGEGTVTTEQTLELTSAQSRTRVTVRGLQNHNSAVSSIAPVSRVALNLRGIAAQDISRGDALITPDAWHVADVVDVSGTAVDTIPTDVTVHIGAASLQAHVRPLSHRYARLKLSRSIPVQVGDRLVVRGSGERAVLGGLTVLDVDPPELFRRGSATERAHALEHYSPADITAELTRRGCVRESTLTTFGYEMPAQADQLPAGVHRMGAWLVRDDVVRTWVARVAALLKDDARDPLSRGVPLAQLAKSVGCPRELVEGLVVAPAEVVSGFARLPGSGSLGAAEAGVVELERRLSEHPFDAPEAQDLEDLGLGVRELAAAEQAGRLLRLSDGVVVLPSTPARAMRVLAGLAQPFTLSRARQALDTTRRVAIPLLEHTDARGWTTRVDGNLRRVRG